MQITLAGSALSRPATDSELGTTSLELAAFDGEIGNSTVAVPDPTGADEVVPGLQVLVSEGTTVLLDGRIVSEGRERGSSPAAGQKQDTYQVDDPNTFMFGFRVVADRPEETDYARMAWFFSTYLPAADTTFVLNTSTSTMVAASYASDGVADIMRDAIDLTGKTLFVHDKAAGGLCAHWHALTGGHTCGLTIDDTLHAADGPATWYPQNPARVRDGADLANDILAYGADETMGSVNVTDATSIATYDADAKFHQTFANFPAATDVATLTADANRLLETNKDPRDSFTCTIGPLDDTALALIRAGDIITVTSEILGLTASPQRISRLRLTVSAGSTAAPGLWDATLTMGAPVRGPGGRFGRSVARPPSTVMPATYVPLDLVKNESFWQLWAGESGHEIAVGLELFWRLEGGSSLQTVEDGLPLPNQWELASFTGPGTHARLYLTFGGIFTGLVRFSGYKITATNVQPAAPNLTIRGGSWDGFSFDEDPAVYDYQLTPPIAVGSGDELGGRATAFAIFGTIPMHVASASVLVGSVYYWALTASINISARQLILETADTERFYVGVNTTPSVYPVPSGHPVATYTIGASDGTTADWTAAPYRPGTLQVLVGGLLWTDGYEETDPAAGDFHFTQIPLAGAADNENSIEVSYVSA